jgi:hypothetical protein
MFFKKKTGGKTEAKIIIKVEYVTIGLRLHPRMPSEGIFQHAIFQNKMIAKTGFFRIKGISKIHHIEHLDY